MPRCIRFIICVCLLMPIGNAFGAELAGKVLRLKGSAQLNGEALALGSDILVGGTLSTGPDSRLQISFLDDSEKTLGENAAIVVDELVYEPDNDKASQSLNIAQGVFSFVSGKIAQASYDNVVLRTPVATIGIRGTSFVGGEFEVGMPPGQSHYGFQLKEGRIEVIAPGGAVRLNNPNEGTFLPLEGVAAPTPARVWSKEAAQEAIDKLAF